MFTTILTCDPEAPGLEPPLIEALRNGWGGGTARWLSRGVAAEFDHEMLPDTLDHARAELDLLGIDLNVVPRDGRRKRLLLADMDSTMIRQECIDELAAEAGVGDRVAAITAKAMNGEIDFEGALRERVGLLAGLDASVIDRVLRDRITMMPGGATLVATMKANGAKAALVSGGFTAFTEVVAARLGFDWNRANTLLIADGRLTGAPGAPILGRAAKVAALEAFAAEMGIAPSDVIAVGDGANDLGMLERAGLGVALHAKPAVQAEAQCRVNHGDLTALLYLQGYRIDDFVD
ncbi:phosphoserine phosphatase SerB [Jannaschia sp. S6380]|uniref:phosphoserine phosphatase SerB n=1 Tax=Jannaschia sp. S6380 TaxID=2926408 RepID=UPI001FF5350C|nr:phosphoserine phosphatase SerB [Jannaschia sp. S6380]MCK0168890.1 phosphoserine phosphatase SerB [Jannaschia sp. S6380]